MALNLSALAESQLAPRSTDPVAQEIMDFVELGYDTWKGDDTAWREVTADVATIDHAVAEARRFCRDVRTVPLTFQTQDYEPGETKTLKYRARDAIRRQRG
jgi:hypothetical protein